MYVSVCQMYKCGGDAVESHSYFTFYSLHLYKSIFAKNWEVDRAKREEWRYTMKWGEGVSNRETEAY